ncbi:MAG: hypothetical protein Q7S87_01405 [Agitococcus sp.]|nr:hypothetical protein [Agitococcus sp.]MDO9177121.1 hypothetical protein [Agitococcus sp.]
MKKSLLLAALLCCSAMAFATSGVTWTESIQTGNMSKTRMLDTAGNLTETTCLQAARDIQESKCVSQSSKLTKKQATAAQRSFQVSHLELQSKASMASLHDSANDAGRRSTQQKELHNVSDTVSRSMSLANTVSNTKNRSSPPSDGISMSMSKS